MPLGSYAARGVVNGGVSRGSANGDVYRITFAVASLRVFDPEPTGSGSDADRGLQMTLLSPYSMMPTAPAFMSFGMSSRTTSSAITLSTENQSLP